MHKSISKENMYLLFNEVLKLVNENNLSVASKALNLLTNIQIEEGKILDKKIFMEYSKECCELAKSPALVDESLKSIKNSIIKQVNGANKFLEFNKSIELLTSFKEGTN